jgi:hypothetical protein
MEKEISDFPQTSSDFQYCVEGSGDDESAEVAMECGMVKTR